jgi:hypothetical protein
MSSAAPTPIPMEAAFLDVSAAMLAEYAREALATAIPTDVVNDLIQRRRMISRDGFASHPSWTTKFPGLTDEQLLTALDVFLVKQASGPKVMPSHGTTLACTKRGRLDATGRTT